MKTIPAHLQESLEAYVRIGRPLGGFLEAVVSNDLKEAFARADNVSRAHMYEIVVYVYNSMPAVSQGSRETYRDWCAGGGLEGQEAMR